MAQSISHKGFFSTGDLVKALSIDKDLIHHYESKGLVSAKSTTLNRRVYNQVDKIRLKFITRARHADYSLQEIELLIGRITPHLTESDEVEENLLFAEKKLNALREQLKEMDALEQINITCDLELLSGYIIELNTLNAKKNSNRHAKKGPQEKQLSPPPRVAEQSKELPTTNWSSRDMAYIAARSRSKKPYMIATILTLILLAGFLMLKIGFVDIEKNPKINGSQLLDKHDRPTGSPEVSRDNVLENRFERKNGEFASNSSHPGTEGAGQAILPIEGAQTVDRAPGKSSVAPPDIDALEREPAGPFADFQPDMVIKEAPELELMKKVIKDMAAKYNAQPGENTMSTAVAEKDTGEDLDLQNDSGISDAFMVASIASTTAAQQEATKKKPASGLTGSDKAVTDTQPKTSKKKETRTTTTKQQSQKVSAEQKRSQPETKQAVTPVVALPPALAKQETPVSERGKTTGNAASDFKRQKTQKKAPAYEEKQERKVKGDTPLKTRANQLAKAPLKSELSKGSRPQALVATESGSLTEASKKASNSAAREWIRTSSQNRKAGDVSGTIVAATVAISLDSALAAPYVDRAWAYARKGLYEKAMEDTTRAIEIEPNSPPAYMIKAEAYQAVGQNSKARAAYEKACTLGSDAACSQKEILSGGDSIEGLLRQSRQDFKKRDWNAVIATSSEVLKLDPDNVIAYANRSAAFLQKGAFERAIADCNEALRVAPDYALAFNNRGYAFEQLGKQKDAEQDYKQACSLGLKLGCKNYEKF